MNCAVLAGLPFLGLCQLIAGTTPVEAEQKTV